MMRKYFEGYYFKCSEGEQAFALIPAFHMDGKQKSVSLQVITEKASYFIPFKAFRFSRKRFQIKLNKSYFFSKGIRLKIDSKECSIYGKLYFGEFERPRYNIMGPFRYVPFMQCRHNVVSMRHTVTGRININEEVYNLKNGIGYIEGDSGYSFPKEYIWTQCHFENGSLMLAVADIPLLGIHFKGIIGAVMIDGREYRIATYLGAKVVLLNDKKVVVKQGKYTFVAKLIKPGNQGLAAPVNGRMERTIHESVACEAYYKFMCGNKSLFELKSNCASFEYEMGKV